MKDLVKAINALTAETREQNAILKRIEEKMAEPESDDAGGSEQQGS